MANALQESVFAAIDTLVGQRIDSLKLDKTVTATIVSCTNSLTGEYKVSYNGGTMTAYANEGATYNKNAEVYVLVPQNDFTKTKYIISKAQALANDNNISFVSSALSNYNLIGRNILFDKDKNLPQGVCSYYTIDNALIYDRNNLDSSLITINDEEFLNNLKEAEALMVEASFLTKLPREHRLTSTGTYGVKFTLAFKDASNSKVQLIEAEDIINNTKITILTSPNNTTDFNKAKEEILKVQEELEKIWANPGLNLEDKQKLTSDANNKIYSWININEANNTPLSSSQRQEIQDLIDAQNYKDTSAGNVTEDQEEYIKYYDYVIDSNNMTGNPFIFNTWADQYVIYPVEVENFLYIQRITFFCENFVTENDNNSASNGDTIFIKDLEIYGLKTISAKNGDYSLSLSMPRGSTFKTLMSTEYLEIVGRLNNKNANISDSSMFYWFVEDNRITSTSEYYQYYGGAGWRYLKDKKNTPNLIVSGIENRAYENKYLCVGVYQDTVILKEYFTLYNDAARRQIEITSSLGVNFSFDQGTPKLTCLIDNKSENFESDSLNPLSDDHYRFIWSKTDEFGSSVVFNQTIEDIDNEIENIANDSSITNKGQLLLELKARKQALQGVNFEVGKNWLEYPMKLVRSNGSATFKCSIYKTDEKEATDNSDFYPIGSAEIILQNSSVATPTDYYIIIENGDQVFQYSESGVSPDDERYQDPLEIKPLTCHFFYPSGEEVESAQYTVKWLVPISDTMIVTPKEGMISNPATGRIEWNTSQIYPTQIKGDYNYQALNNQVTCIVNFNNQEYTKETTFLFTKVGENGTNGTDLVGKVSPLVGKNINILEKEMLALRLKSNEPISSIYPDITDWNNGLKINEPVLQFSLYQRNEELAGITAVKWQMASGNSNSKYMQTSNILGRENSLNWNTKDSASRKFQSLIVRAQCTYRGGVVEGGRGSEDTDTYYAFFGIPIINYFSNYYHIGIDSKKTLKTILYNADGRNPMYNKNQGIKISIDSDASKYIKWRAEGGINSKSFEASVWPEHPNSPSFSLVKEEIIDDKTVTTVIDKDNFLEGEDLTEISILPDDIYDGAYTNNLVYCQIYTNRENANKNLNPEVELYIPIHMSLNTYGLASLNGWDGNHIQINNEDNYILAPQIGAGVKEEKDNSFTGVVMGSVQTYDQKDPDVGLFGYSGGKQSIWLDARTGNATFGLPEIESPIPNEYTEGRIELRPGGESKIGSWRIGSKSLFNIYDISFSGNNFILHPTDPAKTNNSYTGAPKNAQIMIPHTSAGILLNSFPSFITLKTPPIDRSNAAKYGINFDADNMAIKEGDAISLELDPNKSSIFTIYRNTLYDMHGNLTANTWRRQALVGINSNGKFYTNSLKADSSSFEIGGVDAFGTEASDAVYVGFASAYSDTNFFKTFVKKNGYGRSSTLYLSGGTKVGKEYGRPISIHGKDISIYTSETASNALTTDNKITLSGSSTGSLFVGRNNASYLNLSFNASSTSSLVANNNLNISIPRTKQLTLTNGTSQIALRNENDAANKGLYINTSNYKTNVSGSHTESISNGNYSLTSRYCNFTMTNTIHLEVKDSDSAGNITSKIYLNPKTNGNVSTLLSGTGWDINSNGENHGINIRSSKANEGIKLAAIANNSSESKGVVIAMTPDQTGTNSQFALRTPQGTFTTSSNLKIGSAMVKGFIFSTPVRFKNGGLFEGYMGATYAHLTGEGNNNSFVTRNLSFYIDGYSYFSKSIFSSGPVYANDLYWSDGKRWTLGNGHYTSTRNRVWAHLQDIYAALNDLSNRVSTAQSTANTAKTNAANVAQAAANAQSTADTALSTANSKVSQTDFNAHRHKIISGNTISDKKSAKLRINKVTSIPEEKLNLYETYAFVTEVK